jgi:hypothetical protein
MPHGRSSSELAAEGGCGLRGATTALGMEMPSREALLRASQADCLRVSEAEKQDLILDTDQDQK